MDKALRPERFDTDPDSSDARKQWNHWYFTFQNYLTSLKTPDDEKFQVLANLVSLDVFEYIADCKQYKDAIDALISLYVKPKNIIYARHLLSTCKQEVGQNLDQFMQKLKRLAKDCGFKTVNASDYHDETIRDAFIRGMLSNNVRQRLLEEDDIDLAKAFTQARALETAESQSLSYTHPHVPYNESCALHSPVSIDSLDSGKPDSNLAATIPKCFFCGYNKHPRSKCPAREALCRNCNKVGHFQRVCKSNQSDKRVVSCTKLQLSTVCTAAFPTSLSKAVVQITVNGISLNALIDTGSSDSYICSDIAYKHCWHIYPSNVAISMASTTYTSVTQGHCLVTVDYRGNRYSSVKLSLLPNLCSDVLLGHDFLKQHQHILISFGGSKPPFSLCSLTAAYVEPPTLFGNLSPLCKPIATKSRRLSSPDQKFVESEVRRLLAERIIEPSCSSWRAQVLMTSNVNHKKRMVVDYSQTVNRSTYLDAYPLPRIDELVEKISQYEVYTTLDLQSAYHEVPIREDEKLYTAFEACGNLYQFCRIPFGVTNGVACFQRLINNIITKANLKDTFAYVDNVTICGQNMSEHNINYGKFLNAAKEYGLTFNEDKTTIAAHTITLLGFQISHGVIKPDPERFRALRELPPPPDLKSQQRTVGMFAYYSNWISHFSDKIHNLIHNKIFPLPDRVKQTFEDLKRELENAAVVTVNYQIPLVVETDVSDTAVAATLNQDGRPVAFFSRTLNPSERNHSPVEKEAYAIVEALRKWRHYLLGVHFKLLTDQQSVSFMFDDKHKGKVKNDKILRWRIELSCFSYDVVYRPGKEDQAADALSRGYCASMNPCDLKQLHESLCHPGVTRMLHFVRSKKLPSSTGDVKASIARCSTCAERKPRFYTPPRANHIEATQPFERLSVDFRGPLPSTSCNKYLLTVIDEFSRFPFAFACSDISSSTVINCFCQLFSIFGLPAFVHTDRGAAFMSSELTNFLHGKGVATSRTTPYNPAGNGQVERPNSTLWKAITLTLKSGNLRISYWESALLDALHSVRSLLCTSTNATPHERMFSFNRRSNSGTSLPKWLISGGPVLLKKQQRASKYDPVVEEVELLDCNPQYAHVRLPNGKEETVSVKHLAPREEPDDLETSEYLPDANDLIEATEVAHEMCSNDEAAEFLTPANYELLKQKQQRLHPYSLRSREA
ncbi:uncharacterized protein DEA37_0011386 [Paragonimus westermani]|uniref:RNA-directed DNA polymerase n=1 Tax=Paragonimus westermani TaxID=34504 RepID=A0A5J4NIF8_9TREM|nr:uncharacterized protein DEA37_0011386 [Paragonimus westermani]